MNNKLSVASRILVAFASGALIAVFFLPAWRIDLFAPQYPEGLTMNIWINGLSGDVDVINGLNHYIGMKHITVDMFPEFKFLPYVVAFFMLLGMLVAVTGSRRFLLIYLGLTVIGGILAMYDFYQWGYKYGHNLDPTAPIQVPGMSYQPPLIGHKRLLNFDSYSFPDVGGWIVIAAGALAFAVWFAEWWQHRKTAKKNKAINFTVPVLLVAFFMSSCSVKPEPFKYGQDNCYFCKMGIVDPKYGCEIVTKKGKVYKFDDLVCMINYLHSGTLNENEIAKKVVINFNKENDFLEVSKAVFWVSPELRSPMGSNAGAFNSKEDAEKIKDGKSGSFSNWEELYNKVK
ncbi:MAG TPA: nitrous oxide reductase accessory protein NosL [Chitinophagaceae bacterium]|nr:nitrous oxide reductase accessory protein NosL [Chitinophagaceae bacterium]